MIAEDLDPKAYQTVAAAPNFPMRMVRLGHKAWGQTRLLGLGALSRHRRYHTTKELQVAGASLNIPVVVPTNTGSNVVAAPPVGAMVAVPPTVGFVTPIAPPPEVITDVTRQTVAPVIVHGEVMVGAVLPTAAPVYDIPASPCTTIPTSTDKGC